MTYQLKFRPLALNEWEKLSPPLRGRLQEEARRKDGGAKGALDSPPWIRSCVQDKTEGGGLTTCLPGRRRCARGDVGKRDRGEVYKTLALRILDEH